MKFYLHSSKAFFSLLSALILLIFMAGAISAALWPLALICAVLSLVYLITGLKYLQALKFTNEGIEFRCFPGPRRVLSWSDIQEIGICGIEVLKGRDKDHTGPLYIYFSESPLTDDDRFQMCLSWPPRNRLYLHYSEKAIRRVQRLWSKDIVMYHTGHLTF